MKFSIFILKFIKSLFFILTPINNILYKISRKKNIGNEKNEDSFINENELSEAIELTSDKDLENEKNILQSIMSLSKIEAKQIMTPRVNILAIDKEYKFNNVLDLIIKNKYSRMPVYENNLDKIIGIIYIKDLMKYLDKDENFDWLKLVKKFLFYS